jgi:hypothetical protein
MAFIFSSSTELSRLKRTLIAQHCGIESKCLIWALPLTCPKAPKDHQGACSLTKVRNTSYVRENLFFFYVYI